MKIGENNDDKDIEELENVDDKKEGNLNIVFLQEVEGEDSGTKSDNETESEQQDGEGRGKCAVSNRTKGEKYHCV